MKKIRNSHIAKKYGVSRPTVAKWVEAAEKKENKLELKESKDRLYIVDSESNRSELLRLAEKGQKYRNKIVHQKQEVNPKLYEMFAEEEVAGLFSNLENSHSIGNENNLKHQGADFWLKYNYSAFSRKDSYHNLKRNILQSNLQSILLKLRKYKKVNLFDCGWDCGFLSVELAEGLAKHKKEINYHLCSPNDKLTEITEKYLQSKLPEINKIKVKKDIQKDFLLSDLFYARTDEETCNLILLTGDRLNSIKDRDSFFSHLYQNLTRDSFVLLDSRIISQDKDFGFQEFIDSENVEEVTSWLPDLLGINEEVATPEDKFTGNKQDFVRYYKLSKDFDLIINEKGLNRKIRFLQNQKIYTWKHFSFRYHELAKVLEENHFSIISSYVLSEKSLALLFIQPQFREE